MAHPSRLANTLDATLPLKHVQLAIDVEVFVEELSQFARQSSHAGLELETVPQTMRTQAQEHYLPLRTVDWIQDDHKRLPVYLFAAAALMQLAIV